MSTQTTNPSNEGAKPASPPDYKAKLDEVAMKAKNALGDNDKVQASQGDGGIIDKVSQYIPAVGKMMGTEKEPKESPVSVPEPGNSGPPNRPEHDGQIQEFIREQHRSTGITGMEE
ncbi:hypothetical protein B0T17DRAFT_502779 [Bombardia bombarda]|uniref:Uncharacterized protein n=1 Tax=Bombardia bombarda TaxID=252184 RepID=A0AA40CF75_9PEZI|nr:hypothetical protein B0T17DRAFT_502779 [Bombardia bombarda]